MKIRRDIQDVAKIIRKRSEDDYSVNCTEYADLLFGVGCATSAGPTLPSGSIHVSPETLEKDNGGYSRNQPIVGFGQAYISGSGGTKCYGNFLLAPVTGELVTNDKDRACFAVCGTETAKCYEYSVQLRNGIKIKVTPAHNSAIYEFEYPKGQEAFLYLDVARKLDKEACMEEGFVTADGAKRSIIGGGTCTGNWNAGSWRMYFALEIDKDIHTFGTVKGDKIQTFPGSESNTETVSDFEKLGAYVSFGVPEETLTVRAKIAISFTSAEKARSFLDSQIPDFDYGTVLENARKLWRKTLGVIHLETDDKALLRRFYTAIYHMNIQPRDRMNDSGVWDDFHTVWDTWKTVFPLYSLLYPERMGRIVDSFIDRAKKNLEKGTGIVIGDQFMAGIEGIPGQGGNDVDNVIADAYLKGVALERYDWEDAYKVLLMSAENMRSVGYNEKGYSTSEATTVSGAKYTWRFKPAATTLGFAFNDKAVSAVARELGTKEEYEKYEKRSASWQNVWNMDVVSEGFCGFPQTRNDDGSFTPGFDAHKGYNTDFYEATGWDASYINYNDTDRLVDIMGGSETFTKRLIWACEHSRDYFNDDNGKEGYLNFTNEPSFHIPWLFCTDKVRRPDLAAKVIDTVIERFSLQDDYPGDDDNGGMSSFYVFMMCGFFPYATTEYYYLHGTRVKNITFRLGNGKDFFITGENAGGKNIYVQSATWQGKELNECRLTHKEILEGGELHFVMGDKPSDWARN